MTLKVGDLTIETDSEVYAPSDDSFLLSKHLAGVRGSVLEIGCGTGLLSLISSKYCDTVLGVDINPKAVKTSKKNKSLNNVQNAGFVVSDLFENVEGKFDFIVFNPPYVISEGFGDMLDRAWDGGRNGVEVIERFISKAGSYLRPGGTVLLLISSQNGLDHCISIFGSCGFKHEVLETQPHFFEKLYVLKLSL